MKKCITCISNCESCSNFYTCDKCNEGSAYNSVAHLCLKGGMLCPDGSFIEEKFLADEEVCEKSACKPPNEF